MLRPDVAIFSSGRSKNSLVRAVLETRAAKRPIHPPFFIVPRADFISHRSLFSPTDFTYLHGFPFSLTRTSYYFMRAFLSHAESFFLFPTDFTYLHGFSLFHAEFFFCLTQISRISRKGCIARSARSLSASAECFIRMAHTSESACAFVRFVRSV